MNHHFINSTELYMQCIEQITVNNKSWALYCEMNKYSLNESFLKIV